MKKFFPFRRYFSQGFWKAGLLFLGLALSMITLVGFRVYGTFRWGMAECLLWQGEQLKERFLLNDEEIVPMSRLVSEFAAKIASGTISPKKGFSLLRALYQGPVFSALLHKSVKNKLLFFEVARQTDLRRFEEISFRFFQGVESGKIHIDDWKKVRELMIEQKFREKLTSTGFVVPETIEIFKKDIGLTAFFYCLSIMEQANKHMGENSLPGNLNPCDEIKKIIN